MKSSNVDQLITRLTLDGIMSLLHGCRLLHLIVRRRWRDKRARNGSQFLNADPQLLVKVDI